MLMSSEAAPTLPAVQSPTQKEMEFLMGEIHRNQSDPPAQIVTNSILASQLGFYGGLAAGACSSSCHSAHTLRRHHKK